MKAKKSLGQHFLTCDWVLDELIKAGEVEKSDTILEVGPGTGVLTRALAEYAGRVVAAEKDERLAVELFETLAKENILHVNVAKGDILHFDFTTLPPSYKVIANIPYYLTARLIRILLETKNKPSCVALTVQKEVARRIVAKTPDMNLLALSTAAYADASIIADVPASCFRPKPKVTSSIIKISRISEDFFAKNNITPEMFFSVAKMGFSSKRKMLASTLRAFASRERLVEILANAGIAANSRPQELSPQNWADITRALSRRP